MYIMRALEYLCCAPCRTVFWIICCTPGVGGAPVREREYTLFVGNCSAPYQNKHFYIYSEKQKTVEYKDDIKEIIKCFWCCYNAYSFTSNSLNNLLSKIVMFTVAVPLKIFLFWCLPHDLRQRRPDAQLPAIPKGPPQESP